jgi:predicted RNA-binding protein with RPS1 domain|uniref:S1 RNA-binding domain-containing protein n=1 Tax=Mesoaciditoga lauensis TaxID=1495039 RepID=A0A7V3RF50_9BACT
MSVKTGQIFEGTVTAIKNFGVFVKIDGEGEGLVHISKITSGYVKDVSEYLNIGQKVKVKVLGVGENGKMDLSIKDAGEIIKKKDSSQPKEKEDKQTDFEQKMSKFLKESQQKSSDLKKRSDRYG